MALWDVAKVEAKVKRRIVRRNMGTLVGLVGLTGLAAMASSGDASAAAPFPVGPDRISSPGRSVAGEDTAEALVLNPANLARLPSYELRWTGVLTPDTYRTAGGHSFDLATPLLWGLATGLRVDWVLPPSGSIGRTMPFHGVDYTWLTWGLGLKLGERLSVGGSLQWSYSSNPVTDGLFGITGAVSYRPTPYVGLAWVAQTFNGPIGERRPPSLVLGDGVYVGGLALRPLATRAIELALEGKYYPAVDDVRPRVTLAVDVPGFGRVRTEVEVSHGRDAPRTSIVQGTVGAEMYLGALSMGGGALFDRGLGASTSVGGYATASIAGYRRAGVPLRRRGVSIRMESTPGNRSHVHLLRRLWKIAEDDRISSVTMIVRAEPATTLAHAEELADAFRNLRAHGKKVICSFEDAGAKALYACASADRVVVNPAGGIRYAGLKTTHMYLAGLLDKIGVKAEFVRIGAHKSAPEQFMNEHASDVARADQDDLLRNYEAVFARNMALYRHISEDRFRAISAKGPFVASEAKAAGLVDGFAFDDELDRVTQETVGRNLPVVKYESETREPERFGPRGTVGLLYIDGDIIDGRSRTVPVLNMKLVGSYTVAETVKKLREDRDIKSVVLRIESPGGSSMAADVMWRELVKLAQVKPLIVSMGSVAASGGYYVAAPAQRIFALPLTVTGSIGIFYGKADVSGLLGKLGVNVEVRKTTERADAESFYRGFTDDERRELRVKVGQFYDVFLDRVSQGRHMTKEAVDAVGQGRVWAGQQAVQRGLVDEMGGLRHALMAARKAANLPDDAPIEEFPPEEASLLEYAMELAGLKANAGGVIAALPLPMQELLRGVAPLALYGDGRAMARMEWVPVEDTAGVEEE